MDISETIAPTSDQLDAVDLLAGPRTFVIAAVRGGNAEQPVQIDLDGFPRPWRPGKSMRRVLVAVWGKDGAAYVGRRVRLYCDPDVTFGKDRVGGTRISHMSHLDKTARVPLLTARGKSAVYVVEPLSDEPTPTTTRTTTAPTDETVAACTDRATLRDWYRQHPEWRDVITARVAELDSEPDMLGGES